jgi:hypothetical protein
VQFIFIVAGIAAFLSALQKEYSATAIPDPA